MNMSKIVIDLHKQINWDELYKLANNNPSYEIVFQAKSTLGLTKEKIEKIERCPFANRTFIQILGGYDDERIHNYPSHKNRLTNDNVYSLKEAKIIIDELESIENGMNPNWDEMQKLVYFIGKLRDKIIYHPFHEIQPSKDIRSLRGLISGKTVCAGYALILKEICDRNGIECQYVEGATKKEDAEKGYLTHAWNLIKIGGYYVPIDLTWNAGEKLKGSVMAIANIGNVNNFIRNHIPGKHEKVQNYEKILRNIDGGYLQRLDILINNDSYTTNNVFVRKRQDQSRYLIMQDNLVVRDNQYFMRYFYYDILPDGTLSLPTILYSKTNVSYIQSYEDNMQKMRKKLAEARQKNDQKTIQELEKALQYSGVVAEQQWQIDNLLFSKKNIEAARRRGDHYVGCVTKGEDDKYHTVINPKFAKALDLKQKTYHRKDGTSFVLEEVRPLDLNGRKIYRYILYERMGKGLQRNTIYSEQDILADSRDIIPNYFLARDRINRKKNTTNGYVGSATPDGKFLSKNDLIDFFRKKVPIGYRLRTDQIQKYHPDITFDEMKSLAEKYTVTFTEDDNIRLRKSNCEDINFHVFSRDTGQEVVDENLKLRIYFADLWRQAAGIKIYVDDPVPGYRYAFEVSNAEKIFNEINRIITDSVNKYGNINPVEIFDFIIKNHSYKYEEEIITKLFGNKVYVKLINKLYRQQNPSAVAEQVSPHFTSVGMSTNAYGMLAKYQQEKERELKEMLEVKEVDGRVEILSKK